MCGENAPKWEILKTTPVGTEIQQEVKTALFNFGKKDKEEAEKNRERGQEERTDGKRARGAEEERVWRRGLRILRRGRGAAILLE